MSSSTERRERGQQVSFDTGTWTKIAGLILTLMAMGAALAAFTFQSKAESQLALAQAMEKMRIYTDRRILESETVINRDLHRIEQKQNATLRRLEVIGDRVGAGPAVRAVRPMEVPDDHR